MRRPMNLRSIFINNLGRLRSGWRLLLFLLALIALNLLLGSALWIASGILGALPLRVPFAGFLADLVGRLALLLAAIVAGYFCSRIIEGLPWRALGMTLHEGWLRDFLVGSAIGIASLILAVGIATLFGGFRFSFSGLSVSILRTLVSTGFLFIVAALAEEAMFRGYPLQTLSRAHLAWVGVLLTSVPFGIVHLWNPNVVPGVTFANTILAGVWLAIAYLRTRSLWFPLGIHWAWNWALGSLCGIPVSGMRFGNHTLLHASDLGPAWLTGGSYGIEGGAAATLALTAALVFVWRTGLVSATHELLTLTSTENPVIPRAVVSIRPAGDLA